MIILGIYLFGAVVAFVGTALIDRWSKTKNYYTWWDQTFMEFGPFLLVVFWPIFLTIAVIAVIGVGALLPFATLWSWIAGNR